jgi:transitional endoplasmic reticulum ATPase
MSIELFLKKAEEYLEEAARAEAQGEASRARRCYLQASEQLFHAASQSSGKIKRIRVENAEKLLQKAQSIRKGERAPIGESQQEVSSDFILQEKPDVTFDDVAGLDNVKEEIRNKIVYPLLYPEEARKFGIQSGGGVLLYGPPGTGKTYIAKAVAHEVDAVFFSIKPADIMSKWVGESERNIARLFAEARRQAKSVIFIDEVESLIPKRKDSGSTVMQRVVPQILAEMEGIESKKGSILFVGASNEPWSIDHAALRPGRFDEKIYVPPPDFSARVRIFELNLKDRPLEADVDMNRLGELTSGYSGADIRQVCLKSALIPFHESIHGINQRGIAMADLLTTLEVVKPSISQKTVEKYETFKFA